MIYCVCVAPKYRKTICADGKVWVKDEKHDQYVTKKERGVFATRKDAEYVITEPHEIVVTEPGSAA